jgi:hypothetical protein
LYIALQRWQQGSSHQSGYDKAWTYAGRFWLLLAFRELQTEFTFGLAQIHLQLRQAMLVGSKCFLECYPGRARPGKPYGAEHTPHFR